MEARESEAEKFMCMEVRHGAEMHAEMVNELVHLPGRRTQMTLIVHTATNGRASHA